MGRWSDQTPEQRFWAKVDRPSPDSCWLWTAAIYGNGYGHAFWGGRHRAAHRVSYQLLVGPVPAGRDLDHLCRVRHCVNPAHLEPVSRRENLLRGETTTARNAAKTHCKRGHPLISGNIFESELRKGWRICVTCNRERARRWTETHPHYSRDRRRVRKEQAAALGGQR